MLRFHIEVKITHLGSGKPLHEVSYDANGEHTHRLLFAIDPMEAAHFAIDTNPNSTLTPKRLRKAPPP